MNLWADDEPVPVIPAEAGIHPDADGRSATAGAGQRGSRHPGVAGYRPRIGGRVIPEPKGQAGVCMNRKTRQEEPGDASLENRQEQELYSYNQQEAPYGTQ